MSQIFASTPDLPLRRSYSFEQDRDIGAPTIPPLQLDSEFAKQFDFWTKEATLADEGKEPRRRSLSRKLSDNWRRSWANRRNYLAMIGISEDGESDVTDWATEGREKVKKVKSKKLRDWSGELSEDDIGISPPPYKRVYNTPIVWAENACDIESGRHWRFISPLD